MLNEIDFFIYKKVILVNVDLSQTDKCCPSTGHITNLASILKVGLRCRSCRWEVFEMWVYAYTVFTVFWRGGE